MFSLQVVLVLPEPGRNFGGGESVRTVQRPRLQARTAVTLLRQGDATVFTAHDRPLRDTRTPYPVTLRHGGSVPRAGRRHTAGIILTPPHDGARR